MFPIYKLQRSVSGGDIWYIVVVSITGGYWWLMTVVQTTVINEWVDSQWTVIRCSAKGKLIAALRSSPSIGPITINEDKNKFLIKFHLTSPI
jgi:hypothetical protein